VRFVFIERHPVVSAQAGLNHRLMAGNPPGSDTVARKVKSVFGHADFGAGIKGVFGRLM
jgi:hypothetical protein